VVLNILTSEQRESLKSAVYDLSIGYPSFPLTDEMEEHLAIWSRQSLPGGTRSRLSWRGESDNHLLLLESVCQLLRAPVDLAQRMEVTFSGSIAIQRAIIAAQRHANRSNRRPVFILVEPCIDIYRSMLDELGADYCVLNRLNEPEAFNLTVEIEMALGRMQDSESKRMPVLIVDSPSNPLGEILNSNSLLELGQSISSHSGLLLVDHCFALAGIHESEQIDLILHSSDFPCPWIAVWDTGKTFNLNGDKLGLLFASNEEIFDSVRKSLETIQVSASPRDVSFFSQFLSHPAAKKLITTLHLESNINFSELKREGFKFVSHHPIGGTFASLAIPTTGIGSIEFRRHCLLHGVAVASGISFQASSPDMPAFIRISLARPREIFAEALSRVKL